MSDDIIKVTIVALCKQPQIIALGGKDSRNPSWIRAPRAIFLKGTNAAVVCKNDQRDRPSLVRETMKVEWRSKAGLNIS